MTTFLSSTPRLPGRLAALASAALLLSAIAPAPAGAGFVVAVQSVTYSAGSTNDTLNVTLTNTGPSAVTVGGFAFQISAGLGSGLTFTAVDTSTTPAYIFAGHSTFGPDISNQPPNLPGRILAAEDNYSIVNAGVSLGAGSTVGLGDVHFNLSSTASGPILITLAAFPLTNFADASGHDITTSVGTSLSNGTVTVGSSAVPEPSSLWLTSAAMIGSSLVVLARRASVARGGEGTPAGCPGPRRRVI